MENLHLLFFSAITEKAPMHSLKYLYKNRTDYRTEKVTAIVTYYTGVRKIPYQGILYSL